MRTMPVFVPNLQGQYNYLSKVKDKTGIPELQVIIAFNKPEAAQQTYKERRQIETAFRGLKPIGFNIEDTHLTDLKRIEKLFSVVMVAFAWAYAVGVFVNENIKPVRILKNGKRAKSLFKYGLEISATVLLDPRNTVEINVCHVLRPLP